MANGNHLLSRSVHVHPVFLVGVCGFLVSFGALLGHTLFAAIAAGIGASVTLLAVMWMALALFVVALGVWRSFEGGDDAE